MIIHGKMWLAAGAVFLTAACSGTATTSPLVQSEDTSAAAVASPAIGQSTSMSQAPSKSRALRSGYLVASGRSGK